MRKAALITLVLLALFISCRKENMKGNCDNLKEGIAANDVSKVKMAINNIINGLRSTDYNEPNVTNLCQHISSGCSVTAEFSCYDCIKTNPSQTEIIISFIDGGTSRVKIVDISYTSQKRMTFHNMHD